LGESSTLVLSTVPTPVSCFGGANGAIDLTVVGGTPGYTYDWSNNGLQNPDTDPQDLAGLTAGNYVVTVTDAAGCSKTISTQVAQPTALNLAATVTNVSCFGGANGAINLSVSGGTADYTYVWSSGETTQDINGLLAGTYNVTVTDANGCTAVLIRTVTQPANLNLTALVSGATAPIPRI